MIEHCNSRNFDDVDGILGFGWADQPRSAALLKTLTQRDRPGKCNTDIMMLESRK